jgi:hypothetical protein
MCGPECRHQLFETARQRAGYTISQLWVQYLGLGGDLDLFAIEAYLSGLALLPPDQQDVLASAVNEHLNDLHDASKVAYLDTTLDDHELFHEDPVDVLDELLRRTPGSNGLWPSPAERQVQPSPGPVAGKVEG